MSESNIPSTMTAWQYSSTKGGLEKNLVVNTSAPLPKAKPTQHLVQVIAAALNPVDYKPAEVQLISYLAITKPATPGIDFVGRLVVPASGSTMKAGQLVFGMAMSSLLAGGALGQYTLVGTEGAAVLPEGVDAIGAAGVGVAGLTAYQTIVPNVKKGDRVFINGGSGGTGVFGIQIAKAVGCHVTTSCSTPNVELCKSLGADEVVDYKTQNLVDALKASEPRYDLVIDNVGSNADLYWRCHEYTKPEAVYVQIAGTPSLSYVIERLKMTLWPGFLGGGKRKITGFFAQPKVKDLDQIATWMQEGKVKSVVENRYAFEQAPEAFAKLKTGRTRGKIVVDVD